VNKIVYEVVTEVTKEAGVIVAETLPDVRVNGIEVLR
jgi:hypothetical protein